MSKITNETRFVSGNTSYRVVKIYSDKKVKIAPVSLTLHKYGFPSLSVSPSDDSKRIIQWREQRLHEVCSSWVSGSDVFWIENQLP